MLKKLKNNKAYILFFALIIFTLITRFYNLNWGAPFYFHPDERNIASSISQLQFPNHLNPHFFAYGSLPIYLIYFTGVLYNLILFLLHQTTIVTVVNFSGAILISRLYSAIFSLLLIPSLFYIAKKLYGKKAAFTAAFLGATSTGLIQFAHFGTFEMWLTFFGLWLFYFCYKLIEKITWTSILITSLILGILISVKVSSLVLLLLPMISLIPQYKKTYKLLDFKKYLPKLLLQVLVLVVIPLVIFVLTEPFMILDTQSFLGSLHYESDVATGALPVFYTKEFLNTTPFIFQIFEVYPFLLNVFVEALFIISFFFITLSGIKRKSKQEILLILFYLFTFTSQAVLFVKWTRYIVPTLPFIYLFIAVALTSFFRKKILPVKYNYITVSLFTVLCLVLSLSYFITVFVKPDTRIQAATWAQAHILPNSKILSETYDLGIIPFNQYFSNITLFNFYDLDNNSYVSSPQSLSLQLLQNSYIILPSQRLAKISQIKDKQLPKTYAFYHNLLNGKLGFILQYRTTCDILCKLTYLGNPVFSFEETANIFDRPTVYILKKDKNLSQTQYQDMLSK